MKLFPHALLCLALLAGCAPSTPFKQAVKADTAGDYGVWKANLEGKLSPDELKWATLALQEFSLQLMRDGKVSGRDAIDAAVREKINGRSLGEVELEGLKMYQQRRHAELVEMEAAFKINDGRRIDPHDKAKLEAMAAHQENLKQKIDKLGAELSALQAEIARVEGVLKS